MHHCSYQELSPGSKSRYEPLHLQSFAIADALLLLETVTLIFYTVHKDFEVDSNLPGLSRHTSCASEQAGRAGTTRQNSAGSEIRDMARDPQCDVVHGVSVAELHSTMRHTLSVFKLWSTAFPVIKPRLLFFQVRILFQGGCCPSACVPAFLHFCGAAQIDECPQGINAYNRGCLDAHAENMLLWTKCRHAVRGEQRLVMLYQQPREFDRD